MKFWKKLDNDILKKRSELINSIFKEVLSDIVKIKKFEYSELTVSEFIMLIKSFYKDNSYFAEEFFNLPKNASNTDYYRAFIIKEKMDKSGLTDKEKVILFRLLRKRASKYNYSKRQ